MPFGKSGVESFTVRPIFPLNGGTGLGSTSCAATGANNITTEINAIANCPVLAIN
jgi:hypothetical protein